MRQLESLQAANIYILREVKKMVGGNNEKRTGARKDWVGLSKPGGWGYCDHKVCGVVWPDMDKAARVDPHPTYPFNPTQPI